MPSLPLDAPAPINPSSASPRPDSASRKRARPTKSCLECRRKKLRCDRVQPCIQCTKLGREALCVYAHGPSGTPDARGNSGQQGSNKRPRVDVSKLASWGQTTGIPPEGGRSIASDDKAGSRLIVEQGPVRNTNNTWENHRDLSSSLGRIYVEGASSRYVGLGDRMTLLDHFESEKDFIMRGLSEPGLSAMINEMATFQKTFHPKTRPAAQSPENRPTIAAEMLNCLPEDSIIETLTTRYGSNLENVLRVLHLPTFIKQCDEIRAVRKSQMAIPSSLPESALVQLLGVLVIASRLNDSRDTALVAQQVHQGQITSFLNLIRRWLESLKGKQRITLPVLQAQTLLLIANTINNFSMAELWKESGNLVRIAMIMGLHRDPEDVAEMSKFEKELRRKIWRTIVELDLWFSLSTSLPPAIEPSGFNSKPLVHVDDGQLTEDMTEYPAPFQPSEWSDALPQIILGQSLKERLHAANMLSKNIIISRDAEELVVLAKSLEGSLHFLHSKLPTRSKKRHTLFSDIMLDIHLRRLPLALYRIVALSDHATRFPEARRGALRGSIATLSHSDALDPTVADLDTIKSRDYLNLFHIVCKMDIIQAALLLCYEIRAFSSSRNQTSAETDDESVQWTKHSLTRIVENTLNSYFQRLGEFGSDLKIILPLSIVLQSVRSDGTPEGKRELMTKGTERVLLACRKALPEVQSNPHTYNAPAAQGVQLHHTPTSDLGPGPGPGENWNPQQPQVPLQYQNRPPQSSNPQFNNFNQIPQNNFPMTNFDFGFSDWDMGQPWF
ncbi:uncharacterized protein BP5553_08309 [Venustampulla echinocandica]|uniref:Zn(2)-C6 fungal-type domain-containing protein n=1 Tax=Venustampulla echinocandica TaxID=2656787 RepID=A0A370TGD1_9HELO|nr:uncharacterized protein BP5553_08309 [Venustampulla echinocandica]RDL33941.1 hypothetical protein BP5553_08309 [Venustampulla echinocandica]